MNVSGEMMGNFCCEYSRDWDWLSYYRYKYDPRDKEIWLGKLNFERLCSVLECFVNI